MKKEENKTINQFDSDHIDWLKDKLSFIQKNQFANTLYDRENPFKVTQAELDFICEEDQKSERYFMDYLLKEWNPRTKKYSPRWIRQPYQTDSQVKRYLSYYFSKKCKDKISNLRITSERMLEKKVYVFNYETNQDETMFLRENWFDERYRPWTQEENFSYKDIIEFSHDIKFEVVDEKDSEYFKHCEYLKSKEVDPKVVNQSVDLIKEQSSIQ